MLRRRARPFRVQLRLLTSALVAAMAAAAPATAGAQQRVLGNETPAHFRTADSTWDYSRRDVMIPMRDGVRLHTEVRDSVAAAR